MSQGDIPILIATSTLQGGALDIGHHPKPIDLLGLGLAEKGGVLTLLNPI